MPRLTFSQSIAAAGTFDPFATWQYRYAPWPARVRILSWTTATGVTQQHRAGTEQIQDTTPVPFAAGGTKIPSVFDVDPLDYSCAPGDLLSALFTNTTGGALTVTGILDINPR
jgi:hypothetical protein